MPLEASLLSLFSWRTVTGESDKRTLPFTPPLAGTITHPALVTPSLRKGRGNKGIKEIYFTRATHSISIPTSFGSLAAWTAARAGNGAGKNSE